MQSKIGRLESSGVFDVIFEKLQSRGSMHLSRTYARFAFTGLISLLSASRLLAQNELGSSTLPPTAGVRSNTLSLTVTNFVADRCDNACR